MDTYYMLIIGTIVQLGGGIGGCRGSRQPGTLVIESGMLGDLWGLNSSWPLVRWVGLFLHKSRLRYSFHSSGAPLQPS